MLTIQRPLREERQGHRYNCERPAWVRLVVEGLWRRWLFPSPFSRSLRHSSRAGFVAIAEGWAVAVGHKGLLDLLFGVQKSILLCTLIAFIGAVRPLFQEAAHGVHTPAVGLASAPYFGHLRGWGRVAILVFTLPDWSWWPRVWRTATSMRTGDWTAARRFPRPCPPCGATDS